MPFRSLGRTIMVDERLIKSRGPVRMQIACRNPEMLCGAVQIFHKSMGYNVGVRLERAPERPHTRPPPPPPRPDDGMDDEDDDEDDDLDPTAEGWTGLGGGGRLLEQQQLRSHQRGRR